MEEALYQDPLARGQAPLERKELPVRREDEITALEDRIANLSDELEKREAELVSARDQALRAMAEADNYKKRLEREREDQKRRDEADLLVSFLPVLDALDTAVEAAGGGWAGADKFLQGIELTRQQFRDILSKRGLVRIEILNKPFDPAISQALMVEETNSAEDGTVVKEFLPGYMFRGSLARPARVAVAKNVSSGMESLGADDKSS